MLSAVYPPNPTIDRVRHAFQEVLQADKSFCGATGDGGECSPMEAQLGKLRDQLAAIERTDARAALAWLVQDLWSHLSSLGEQLVPSTLPSSPSVLALAPLCALACENKDEQGWLSPAPIYAAIKGYHHCWSRPPEIAEDEAKALEALDIFGEVVCAGQWGLKDVWVGITTPEGRVQPPLASAAAHGTPGFIDFLVLKKGVPVEDDSRRRKVADHSPLARAFINSCSANFERLLDLGADAFAASATQDYGFECFSESRWGPKPAPEPRHALLQMLMTRRPQLLDKVCLVEGEPACALISVIISDNLRMVKAVLAATGNRLRYKREETPLGTLLTTIEAALTYSSYEVLELLIREHKILEGYEDKYDAATLDSIAQLLAQYSFRRKSTLYCNVDGLRVLELFLSAGFTRPWIGAPGDECSVVLHALSKRSDVENDDDESRVIAVLERYRLAGFDVTRMRKKDADAGRWCQSLAYTAAHKGWMKILDYAIEVVGCPVDYPQLRYTTALTLLSAALWGRRFNMALSLLTKYKARTAYPELPFQRQPISILLVPGLQLESTGSNPLFTDSQVETLLLALIDPDPALLDIDCFKDGSRVWDPIAHCVIHNKPQLLEMMLSRDLPGASGLASLAASFPLQDFPTARATPAQMAAVLSRWECVDVFLRCCRGLRVTLGTHFILPDGRNTLLFAIDRTVQTYTGSELEAPRALAATIAAKAQRERQLEALLSQSSVPAATSSPSQTAVADASQPPQATAAAPINSFEDPSMRPLTEAEEKRKAKARQKRAKAKAKKRAVNAGAGGRAADYGSTDESDSDEEPFDEPDDNLVDSRFAPSLDLMLEQVRLRDAADVAAASSVAHEKAGKQ